MSGLSLAQRIAERGLTGVLEAIAVAHAVTPAAILGRGRTRGVSLARHAFWGACRERGLSYPEIASLTGHDHTSVIKALRPPEQREAVRLANKVRAGLGPGVCAYRAADVRGALARMRVV